jgi:acetyl-CoA acetyltransferase
VVGDALIIDGVRTPIGRYGGVLASVRPDDLAALVLRALLDRVALDSADLEDVYLGCANQAGEDNRNVARMAALLAGLPVEVRGCTVNRLCGSAAALLLTSSQAAESKGLRPMAAVRSMAVAGVSPRLMGIGPVTATRKALERARLSLADIDLIEVNEAFAAQALAVLQELGLQPDDERVNPNGGAIALGHPLGCSGSRILVTLIHEPRRRQLRYGLATMCIGVGQGIAMVVENLR